MAGNLFKVSGKISGLALVLATAVAHASPAGAASSAWLDTQGAKLRLITLPGISGQPMQAGLQVVLEDGWKTYWRTPGSSGIPPQVNFLGSTNVESATLKFPVPSALDDFGGVSAGYKGTVTFPISIRQRHPDQPVTIKANGTIGICSEICIPLDFALKVSESGDSGSKLDVASALTNARSQLPGKQTDSFHISALTYQPGEKPVFNIRARVPAGSSSAQLFIEGPYNWYLSPATASSIEGTSARFTVSLAGLPKKADPVKHNLTLSLVVDGKGIEQVMVPEVIGAEKQ